MHAIVIDCTWNEAKTLNLIVPPEVPRVVLPSGIVETHQSLFRHIRTRTRETGVCTAEAAALLLQHCGAVVEGETILKGLMHMVDAVCLEMKGNSKTAFGSLPKSFVTARNISQLDRNTKALQQRGEGPAGEGRRRERPKAEVLADALDDSSDTE